MKYPRLPKEKWNKKVLTDQQVRDIQAFYKTHHNLRLTARTFGLARGTVKRHVNPAYKEREAKRSSEYHKRLYHSDETYRDRIKEQVKENQRGLRKRNPAISKYSTEMKKKRYATRPEVRETASQRNARYHKKRKFEVMEKYWAEKKPSDLARAYVCHKESLEWMLKKEPLLILFQ